MASTPPLSSLSTPPVSTAMDSAALRSCSKCHRRMSSLRYDSHTICSQCRDVLCSLDTSCTECKDWSAEVMTEYIKRRKSLATKSGKKPAVAAASVSSLPAVASSPLLGSPPSLPSISDDSKIRDAVLSVLQSLTQSGSVGINPVSISAPSTVPDYTPSVGRVTGGDRVKKPHSVGSLSRPSGVVAFEYQPAVSTTPNVHHEFHCVFAQ